MKLHDVVHFLRGLTMVMLSNGYEAKSRKYRQVHWWMKIRNFRNNKVIICLLKIFVLVYNQFRIYMIQSCKLTRRGGGGGKGGRAKSLGAWTVSLLAAPTYRNHRPPSGKYQSVTLSPKHVSFPWSRALDVERPKPRRWEPDKRCLFLQIL